MDREMDRYVNVEIDRWMNRQTDREIDAQIDTQMDRLTDNQCTAGIGRLIRTDKKKVASEPEGLHTTIPRPALGKENPDLPDIFL